jgi:hypothetical protein
MGLAQMDEMDDATDIVLLLMVGHTHLARRTLCLSQLPSACLHPGR